MANIFSDIGLIIILSTVAAFLLKLFKQPIIPAYILVGIVIGPILGLLTDSTTIMVLSEIGIAFLLFIVGLELDLKKLRDVGQVATIGALAQIILLFAAGFFVSKMLGYANLTSTYIGLVLAFSSTMIVIKLLSDKGELDTLHGRIIIGMLLMQDIVAIIAITVLKDLNDFSLTPFIGSLLQGAGLFLLAIVAGRYVFPTLFRFAAKHEELLFLLSLSICFIFSILFSIAGFSLAIGAFVAGVTLANLPYNIEIISRVRPLRDFFSVLFFTAVGAELVIVDLTNIVWPLIIFTLFTIVLLPLITIVVTAVFGYKTRTSFLTGVTLAQVSEFSLIIVSQGLFLGHVSAEVLTLTVLLTLITMTMTSYFIKYDDWLYSIFGKWFTPLERLARDSKELENIREDSAHQYVLVGLDRLGYSIFKKLRELKKDVVVVDFNPDIIKRLHSRGIPCLYGDIGDVEIVKKLRLGQAKLLISTIPNHQENLFLIKQLQQHHKNTTIIVTSYHVQDALSLYEAGADYVIIPHYLGGEHVSILLEDISVDLDKLINTKLTHIRELRHRQNLHAIDR